MARTKELNPMGVGKTPAWGANSAYAFCDVFGGDAVLFGEKGPGWWATDKPTPSAHPNKVNPGGTVRYFGDE